MSDNTIPAQTPQIDLDALALTVEQARKFWRKANRSGWERDLDENIDALIERARTAKELERALKLSGSASLKTMEACLEFQAENDFLRTQLSAANARADKAEADRDMWAAVSGEWENQMGQFRPGRVTDDALFEANRTIAKERDEARVWLDRAEKNFRDAALALGNWLLVPPDGGDLTLAEGVDRIKAELEAVKADRDEALRQRDVAMKFLRDRPTAPHPVDQMNNLTKFLHEDAEAEVAELRALIEKAVEALKRIVNMESHVARSHIREFAAETLTALTAAIGKGEGT